MMRSARASILAVLLLASCSAVPPSISVTAYTPSDGATGVPLDAIVAATFDRDVEDGSLVDNFRLEVTGGDDVAGTLAYAAASRTATFTPSSPLAFSTQYTATLDPGITGPGGAALAQTVSWSFTTLADPAGIESVTIPEGDQQLTVPATAQLTAIVVPIAGASTAVTWSSSNTAAATVDQSGFVSSIDIGIAIITATSDFDPTKFASVEVSVSKLIGF